VPETPCDVVTLNHVIEHAADPIDLLRECGKRLRPQTGRLIITTPNLKSLGHWWFKNYWRGLEVPRHLVLFSRAALKECIERAGLKVQTLSTETRLARMIYSPSVSARLGGREIGEKTNFPLCTKFGAYFFQAAEDSLMYLTKGVGEEIFCVCLVRKNDEAPNGDPEKSFQV
jgi:SAM-dependent methyltransferase